MIAYCSGSEIFMRLEKTRVPGQELYPAFQQNGGWEIHPELGDLTFNFWLDPANPPTCWVNQVPASFTSETPSWANQLTGFKATDGFGEAKGFLREKAQQLAEKAGFQYDPEKHGYHWM